MTVFPLTPVAWRPGYRIVSYRFPPRGLFVRVACPDELDAVFAIESLTNERLRAETGDITLVAPDERMVGPGATPVMAAFTHLSPNGSRFSDGTFGVFYAARERATAVRETVHHRERFLAESNQPPMTIEMREYQADVAGTLRDLRSDAGAARPLLDPDSYAASQRFGVVERGSETAGIVYPSVRNPGGECATIFRPRYLSPAIQGPHYGYIWNGVEISDVVTLDDSGIAPHV